MDIHQMTESQPVSPRTETCEICTENNKEIHNFHNGEKQEHKAHAACTECAENIGHTLFKDFVEYKEGGQNDPNSLAAVCSYCKQTVSPEFLNKMIDGAKKITRDNLDKEAEPLDNEHSKALQKSRQYKTKLKAFFQSKLPFLENTIANRRNELEQRVQAFNRRYDRTLDLLPTFERLQVAHQVLAGNLSFEKAVANEKRKSVNNQAFDANLLLNELYALAEQTGVTAGDMIAQSKVLDSPQGHELITYDLMDKLGRHIKLNEGSHATLSQESFNAVIESYGVDQLPEYKNQIINYLAHYNINLI